MIIEKIDSPDALKNLKIDGDAYPCKGIAGNYHTKGFLKRGGHLASNLGVVELAIALHYVFHSL